MTGSYQVVMGDRGQLIVPAELCRRANLTEGTPVILVGTSAGVVFMTRTQAAAHVRRQVDDRTLVDELLSDRRTTAEFENVI